MEGGGLNGDAVAKARETARQEGLPLSRVLVRDGLILSHDLAVLTAMHLGLRLVDLPSQAIDPHAVALIPRQLALRHLVLAMKQEGGRLTVAMADPQDLQMIQDLAARTGYSIQPVVAPADEILDHIHMSYRFDEGLSEGAVRELQAPGGRITPSLLRDRPPAETVDLLLNQALQDRSSDIHIEPAESGLRIRFRTDGILHEVMNLSLEMHPALISRLKIMAGMNIAERRRPQDGQFSVESQNRKVDVRASVSNTIHGEMAVLRLLDKKFTLLALEELGLSASALEKYRRLLRMPYGMILVCGPTGSGKSTTLYASILQMNRVEQNVISIEDPVEYHITDTNQIQVHPEANVTFANQLRSILRLDPNVILVGEIRDEETATIAIQASLTGHLVLSSLHANDAVSALVRLRDLGVPGYLIASSVVGIVSQRMVRTVCVSCKATMARPVAEQQAYEAALGERRQDFTYGSGCNVCARTGYRGRTGVLEVLILSDALRGLFLADEPRHRLLEQALKDGMVPLRREGMLKVKEGITTPYEVMRSLFVLD